MTAHVPECDPAAECEACMVRAEARRSDEVATLREALRAAEADRDEVRAAVERLAREATEHRLDAEQAASDLAGARRGADELARDLNVAVVARQAAETALAETRGKLEAAEADLDAKHATLVRVADEKRAAETALRQAQAHDGAVIDMALEMLGAVPRGGHGVYDGRYDAIHDGIEALREQVRQAQAERDAATSKLERLQWGIAANAGAMADERRPRWVHVRNAIGMSRTAAQELCREACFDPDEEVGDYSETPTPTTDAEPEEQRCSVCGGSLEVEGMCRCTPTTDAEPPRVCPHGVETDPEDCDDCNPCPHPRDPCAKCGAASFQPCPRMPQPTTTTDAEETGR